ncbi:MAG: N-6 DNA methylase [Phycisphaerales bacterium]
MATSSAARRGGGAGRGEEGALSIRTILRIASYAGAGPERSDGCIPVEWPWFAGPDLAPMRVEGLGALRPGAGAIDRDSLGGLYEELLAGSPGGARRARGAFYTPPGVARRLVDRALGPLLDEAERGGGARGVLSLRICDPACGSGRFLIAAAGAIAGRAWRARGGGGAAPRALRVAAARCVYGIDLDPLAAEVCRWSLAVFSGENPRRAAPTTRVVAADGLLGALPADWPRRFDAVVGNPPFLNQLGSRTARGKAERARLAGRFGGDVRPYTDTAALFLLRALELVRGGGRIALIQPQSLLSARDAEPIRARLMERCSLDGLWTADEGVFDAGVRVCAPVLTSGVPQAARIGRWTGACFEPHADQGADQITARSWAPLMAAASGVPGVSIGWAGSTIGDHATATADFRDQYYGLRGCVREDGELGEEQGGPAQPRGEAPRAVAPGWPMVVTTGLIDPGACRWGERPCRLLGRVWRAPRADPGGLDRAGLGPWMRARLVPKLLVATQTRTIEAAVDVGGRWLPVTPLITVVPRDPGRLWHLAAALLSPVLSAWAAREVGGAGLSAVAIKLSARQVAALPVPGPCAAWDEAARVLEEAAACGGMPGALLAAAEAMLGAYGVPVAERARLLAWWRGRLGGGGQPVSQFESRGL